MTTERTWPHPEVAEDIAALRREAPLTHCITNLVADNFTANVLLAVGASPAMVIAAEEAGGFAAIAHALLVNVGHHHPARRPGHAARGRGGAGRRASRGCSTRWAPAPSPTAPESCPSCSSTTPIVRGNASEILAVAGMAGGGKGVESTAARARRCPAPATWRRGPARWWP